MTSYTRPAYNRLEDSKDTYSARHSGKGRTTTSLDELSHYYSDMESTGMYKVLSAMDRILGHVKEHRKQEFLCAIMQAMSLSFMFLNSTGKTKIYNTMAFQFPAIMFQKCYEHASRHVERFEKTVRGLLQRPLDRLESDHNGPRRIVLNFTYVIY